MLPTPIKLVLWLILVPYLFWHLFIAVLVLNPMGAIPIGLALCAAFFLRMGSPWLRTTLQVWAIYLMISSGLKLVGAYLQSIGSITYEWSFWSLGRNILYLVIAFFFLYITQVLLKNSSVEDLN